MSTNSVDARPMKECDRTDEALYEECPWVYMSSACRSVITEHMYWLQRIGATMLRPVMKSVHSGPGVSTLYVLADAWLRTRWYWPVWTVCALAEPSLHAVSPTLGLWHTVQFQRRPTPTAVPEMIPNSKGGSGGGGGAAAVAEAPLMAAPSARRKRADIARSWAPDAGGQRHAEAGFRTVGR